MIKALRVRSGADVQAAEAFRTDFHLLDAHRPGTPGGTGESFDWELAAARRSTVPLILAGGLTPANVAEAISVTHPFAVDVASGVEVSPGVKDPQLMAAFAEAARAVSGDPRAVGEMSTGAGGAAGGQAATAVQERFGDYGGRFVPEVLIAALDELSLAWAQAREDADFGHRLGLLLREFVGRPTPLYRADRLAERSGRRVYLKREDLCHTGAHKINNAVGQALLAERMGKRRVIAETGAGQHGVAAATACALLGLDCVVYMGTEDMRRQAPNVERMRLLGARVAPVEAGARTLKEAVSAAIRDWVENVATTHYVIGSAVGPAPYPALVRDLQRVIGDEAREQALAAEGRLPSRVIACVGGGSNAIGTFTAFLDDAEVELIGIEAGGGPRERSPRGLAERRPDRCPARRPLRRARRRGGTDRRGALGLGRARLPGRGTGARPPARHRPGPLRSRHRRSGPGGVSRPGAARGDHPRARALARRGVAVGRQPPDGEPRPATNQGPATSSTSPAGVRGSGEGSAGYDLLTLSGRGDKDLAEVVARLADD